MTKDYGRPGRAADNRALIADRIVEAVSAGGKRESLTVEWRGTPTHLDVIQVPVGHLYYNPATHRVRAQRSHKPECDEALDKDPWSANSQAYLHDLLKALPADPSKPDPDFAKLAESLKEHGQDEPGLVTYDGVLVNGNTRRAALIDAFGPTHGMRVAVLPSSCTWSDVTAVELSLQLRQDHRRDYSYINRLLAVDELVAQGMPETAIAATFRTTTKVCKQEQWALSVIRSMIDRSEVGGTKLPLVAFEDQAEKLRELHRAYEKVHATNPEKAEVFLESRLAAIMLGFSKTDVRFVEQGFDRVYLAPELPPETIPEPRATPDTAIPGLGRSVKGPSDELVRARSVTDAVLTANTAGRFGASLPEEAQRAAVARTKALHEAMAAAITKAGKEARVVKRKQAAATRLTDASQSIELCATDLVLSRASQSLDEAQFDDAVAALRRSVEKLALEARRTVKDPGESTQWLLRMLGEGA